MPTRRVPRRRAVEDPDEHVQRVLDAIRRIVQTLRESAQHTEKRAGVSASQMFALQKLAEAPSMSVNELAGRTFTHQSSVSVVVRRLVERGLVQHSPHPLDARRVDLSVTPSGRRLLKRAPLLPQDRVIAGIRRLSKGDCRSLSRLLDRLLGQMGVDIRTPSMFFEEGEPPRRRSKKKPSAA
jgi:DNA-binding MarR family transcriptional regulator